jgi:DNA polymerase III subunit gamma/tau
MTTLYKKYRPSSLEEMVGNEEVLSTLSKMLEDIDKCPHSFLLTGPTGCGKTTIGRIIAEELGCADSDYNEIDTADFRGIDTVRDIRRKSQFKAMGGDVRVFLIDECHKMTNDAQNAILKLLEDTPSHVYIILATTDPQKLLATVKNRCTQLQMKPLPDPTMFKLLKKVVKQEGEKLSEEIYEQIIQDSLGHPRNALQILDQTLRVDKDQRLEVARKIAEEQSESIALCRALIGKATWKEVCTILKGLKDQEPEGIRRHVLGYAQSVLLNGANDKAALVIESFFEPFFNIGFPGLVYACYSVIKG